MSSPSSPAAALQIRSESLSPPGSALSSRSEPLPSEVMLEFGAAMKVLTGSSVKTHPDWRSAAVGLSCDLGRIGIRHHVNQAGIKGQEQPTKWSINDAKSIVNLPTDNKWGVELISPIYEFQQQSVWQQDFERILKVLNDKYRVFDKPDQCALHVHISPRSGSWTLSQVRAIAKSVLFFERSVDSLVPPERRGGRECQTNRYNYALGGCNLPEACEKIEGATAIRDVALLMCKTDPRVASGGKAKEFRWNFMSLLERKGTIEFRQPPVSESTSDPIEWVRFTAFFVQSALSWPLRPESFSSFNSLKLMNLLELFKFLEGGARIMKRPNEMNCLTGLFLDRKHLPPEECTNRFRSVRTAAAPRGPPPAGVSSAKAAVTRRLGDRLWTLWQPAGDESPRALAGSLGALHMGENPPPNLHHPPEAAGRRGRGRGRRGGRD